MKTYSLYPKLAAQGISKNRRTYIPYIFTCSGMIMMYYIVAFLSASKPVQEMKGGDIMQLLMKFGCIVMIVFSAIFLFYTNSFLIRRRKTEFGLYNILGMDKRNIACILILETIFIFFLSELCGIGCGILFSKLSELLLTKLLDKEASYEFGIDVTSVISALACYAGIFLLILLNTLRQIHLSNPIELLHSENTGEKPPRTNYPAAILGVILLGTAYYIAVSIKNPISAITAFLFAVLLVIAATYLLFTAGSSALCKMLQKNKRYYYKTNHFISVSQMTYRMRRNGAGLASICILSTMVLVTLSSTICLYAGEEKVLRTRYPRNIIIDTYSTGDTLTDAVHDAVKSTLDKFGETPENVLYYSYLDIYGAFEENRVILDPDKTDELSNSINPDIRQLCIMNVSDYNRLMNKSETLSSNEVIIYGDFGYSSIELEGYKSFKVRQIAEDFVISGNVTTIGVPSVFVFVQDESIVKDLYEHQLGIYEQNSSDMHDIYAFDLSCGTERQTEIYEELHIRIADIKKRYSEEWNGVSIDSSASDREEFFALYGVLFFLGIVFGTLFICAAVLIMYYKQLSEGFEDRERYDILQKVGMTHSEIRKSVNSQVLTVFFLPLIAAGVHMAFAFPIISRLLVLFGLTDTVFLAITTLCCFGAFGLLYTIAYIITSKTYIKIIS